MDPGYHDPRNHVPTNEWELEELELYLFGGGIDDEGRANAVSSDQLYHYEPDDREEAQWYGHAKRRLHRAGANGATVCAECEWHEVIGIDDLGRALCDICLGCRCSDVVTARRDKRQREYVQRHNARGVNPALPGYPKSPSAETRQRNTVSGGLPGLGKRS